MKPLLTLALSMLPLAVAAAPVHVALKPSAAVSSDAADFFPLGSVADLTGGNSALRARLAQVPIGRVPLAGDVRHLTQGDLALKLRQAGFEPGRDAILDGATDADVTVAASAAPPASNGGGAGQKMGEVSSPPAVAGPPAILIHQGDPVTIRIEDGGLSISAKGIARDNGAAGDLIHVQREGHLTDLTVIVLDAQTVQLEP